jgi:hypothetical protein
MADRKHKCDKCGNSFSNRGGNFNKHYNSCDGVYRRFVKSSECKWCQMTFEGLGTAERANHSRWCEKNPKHDEYIAKAAKLHASRTEESFKKQSISLKLAHKDGKYDYESLSKKSNETRIKNGTTKLSPEAVENIRQGALKSNHRRLVRSIREYTKKDGTVVLLDSSWEEELARRLDHLGILWERPKEPVIYQLDGVSKRYFPDFYLPEYDLYLDPKNPAAYKAQSRKIEVLLDMMKNLVIICTLDECKNFNIGEHYARPATFVK